MKRIMAFILICGMIVALMGCTSKSEVKTKSSADDKPFGVYQCGIDRAKEVQQKANQRVTTEDSAAAAAKDATPGQ